VYQYHDLEIGLADATVVAAAERLSIFRLLSFDHRHFRAITPRKLKSVGEPGTTGAPARLIDLLHRMWAFREKGDTQGMAQFLARSGDANNHSSWLMAQAVSENLPGADKEKQLMQELINQKEGMPETTRQGTLF
jgi:hypothetical protein